MPRSLVTALALAGALSAHAADGDNAVREARAAFQSGSASRLAVAASGIPPAHPLAPQVESWRLRLALPNADEAAIRAFLTREDGTRAAQTLRLDWLKSLGAKQDWARFAPEYPKLVQPDVTLQCLGHRAELALGRSARIQEAVALWFTGKDMPSACTPLFEQLIAAGLIKPEDLWRRLRLALDAGNPGVARSIAAQLPPAERDGLGELDRAAADPEGWLARGPSQPNRLLREIAVYAIGRAARADSATAASLLGAWRERLGDTEQRAAWGAIGFHAARRHEADALRHFVAAGPLALNDAQREWWARAGLRAGDWGAVATAIDSMSAANREISVWRYWRARAYKAQGQGANATRLLLALAREPQYYGQLAQEELGPTLRQANVNIKPGSDEVEAAQKLPGIARALALYELGWRTDAAAEWNFTVQRMSDDRQQLAAAEVARRIGWYDRAIYAAELTRDHHDFELRFIAPYRELASAAARAQGIDEAWVYGLMRQESRFVNVARSGVGASGLMQIMPATARWIARKLGLGQADAANMGDPETNIRFGTFYLSHLLKQLDNSSVLATAGYNAGPGRAQRWRADTALEGAVYVETIPFLETRDYVRKVLSNAMYYAARFNQTSPLLRERLGRVPPRAGRAPAAAPEDADLPS